MKTYKEIVLNIGFLEAVIRVCLIIPAGILVVFGIVKLHTYLFLAIPAFLLITALTHFGPLKYLIQYIARKIAARQKNVSHI